MVLRTNEARILCQNATELIIARLTFLLYPSNDLEGVKTSYNIILFLSSFSIFRGSLKLKKSFSRALHAKHSTIKNVSAIFEKNSVVFDGGAKLWIGLTSLS